MKRGEVWWVAFRRPAGGEIRHRRPAVILSNDVANLHLNRVQVVPFTRNVSRLYPGEAFVTFLDLRCKALASQIATVDKDRLLELAGHLQEEDLRGVEAAVRIQLGLGA